MRTFDPEKATKNVVAAILFQNVRREATLYTDESRLYTEVGKQYGKHETVKHSSDEYVRSDVYTNTVEGYFSIFKRGMKGIYQHCGEKHLHRYLAEFDFRYNNRVRLGIDDQTWADSALRGVVRKRLTYAMPAK